MSAQPLAIMGTGLVTSVGLNAHAACAAIRAGITNPCETRFMDKEGAWIVSHTVALAQPWRGREKLARMAAMVIGEALADTPREDWPRIPTLLCVAERTRPGRIDGLEEQLLPEIRQLLDGAFSSDSLVIPQGRVGVAVALLRARQLVYEADVPAVLVVGTDSLLCWPTLSGFEEQRRLLTNTNSDGFVPGEAASAVLVGRPAAGPGLRIEGLGFAIEAAHVDAGEPQRGEGLSRAVGAALSDAQCGMHDLDFRITDISGEQYYFKEAALAFSRTLRQRKEQFDLWHPAECIGETGSAIGPATLAVADAACRKGYAVGPGILVHASNDAGQRAAIVTRYLVS